MSGPAWICGLTWMLSHSVLLTQLQRLRCGCILTCEVPTPHPDSRLPICDSQWLCGDFPRPWKPRAMEARPRPGWPGQGGVNDDPHTVDVQHVHDVLPTAEHRVDWAHVQADHVSGADAVQSHGWVPVLP